MKNKEKIYTISSILLIFDQLVKMIVRTKLNLYDELTIIPNFFSIYYLRNNGAAFSILNNQTILLIIIGILAIILLDRFITREKNLNNISKFSLGIIVGGIFGNLVDRIWHNAVIDYFSFTIFGYDFPVFNIADIGITIGTIILIISFIVEEINIRKEVKYGNK